MRRVVITGMGGICALGNGAEEISRNIHQGHCGIGPITAFDSSPLSINVAAEAKIDLKDYFSVKELRRMDRVNAFGILTAREALKDSGLELEKSLRVGAIISSGIGGLDTISDESIKGYESDYTKISPFFIPKSISNMTAAQVAIDLGIHGYVGTPVTACAGSLNAILDGYRSIKNNDSDVILAGGAEASINPLGVGGFAAMRALSTAKDPKRASIPFDREREGFVMGEGGAVLVLEEYEQAKKRGAKIYGEVLGTGISCDGYHITAPREDGYWARKAVEAAIEESGLPLEKIDYVNAHGTSTPLNDKIESRIYHEIFGDHIKDLSISSTKSMTGHLLGAAGAMEALISLKAMEEGFIPPTIGYREYDEDCDLEIFTQAKEEKMDYFIKNALGFGGHNVSVVFGRVK